MQTLPVLMIVLLASSLPMSCPSSPKGAELTRIEEALKAAAQDGKFATHLAPFHHPKLRSRSADNLFFLDGPTPDRAPLVSLEIKTLPAGEMERLQVFFDLPIAPTHLLELNKTIHSSDGSILQMVRPIYLTEIPTGWYVVFGVLKTDGPAHPKPQKKS